MRSTGTVTPELRSRRSSPLGKNPGRRLLPLGGEDQVGTTEAEPAPSAAQQTAESYCEELPLHLCSGCDGCGLRCTEGIRMTRTEYLRIEAYLRSRPGETRRVAAQDKSIPGWPVTRFCQFRDTEKDRCSIYPVRPIICRLFGHTEWLPCPLGIVPLRGQEAMDVYQEYAGEEVRPFDEWRRRLPVSKEAPETESLRR